MSDDLEKQKDEFDDFVNKWDQALEKGIFEKPGLPEVNPQTSSGSFFGFNQTNNTDSVAQTDQEYWNAINMAADDYDPKVINESLEHKASPANPVAKDTFGCDQNMNPQSLGLTYTDDELEDLAELKKELYDLESKLLTSMGFGDDKNQKKIEAKIESIKKEIHKLSDDMGKSYKNENQLKKFENN